MHEEDDNRILDALRCDLDQARKLLGENQRKLTATEKDRDFWKRLAITLFEREVTDE